MALDGFGVVPASRGWRNATVKSAGRLVDTPRGVRPCGVGNRAVPPDIAGVRHRCATGGRLTADDLMDKIAAVEW